MVTYIPASVRAKLDSMTKDPINQMEDQMSLSDDLSSQTN